MPVPATIRRRTDADHERRLHLGVMRPWVGLSSAMVALEAANDVGDRGGGFIEGVLVWLV